MTDTRHHEHVKRIGRKSLEMIEYLFMSGIKCLDGRCRDVKSEAIKNSSGTPRDFICLIIFASLAVLSLYRCECDGFEARVDQA